MNYEEEEIHTHICIYIYKFKNTLKDIEKI